LIHEVVVRNRLEHLRRRQRDEALQAQKQLLAVVQPELPVEMESKTEMKTEIQRIAYLDRMSPRLEPVGRLSRDDMQLEIIPEDIDQQNIVRFLSIPPQTPLIVF
jgi:hypothetical protein